MLRQGSISIADCRPHLHSERSFFGASLRPNKFCPGRGDQSLCHRKAIVVCLGMHGRSFAVKQSEGARLAQITCHRH